MITIARPYVESGDQRSRLCANIHDESRNKDYLIWFSVENDYCGFLCPENADAFLLVSLMVAIQSHQDIKVEAPVSRKLLFNLNNYVVPLFRKIIPRGQIISIYANEISPQVFDARGVGCGCSVGVDSLSALYTHLGEGITDGYRVTHLATFNAGHFGYLDQKEAEKAFEKGVEELRPFSEELGLPIVAVNTNLNEFFLGSFFKNIKSRFIPSTIACVLALQKLFGKYVFASSYSIDDFEISHIDHSHAEAAFVPELSTDSTEIILSCAHLTRVEKTDFIRSNPLTFKYLNVCWADQWANGARHDKRFLSSKTKLNCGWCDKCLRTLYTFELLGEDLDKFESIFDLDKYYQHRQEFIETIYLSRRQNIMYREIYRLMDRTGQNKFPFRVLFKDFVQRLQILLKKIRKRCQKLVKKYFRH